MVAHRCHAVARPKRTSSPVGLDGLHLGFECSVELSTIPTVVSAAVAIGAQCDDPPRIVRAPIAHASNVVRFEVGRAVLAGEGRSSLASLTVSFRARQDVASDSAAPLKDGSRDGLPGDDGLRSHHRAFSQVGERFGVDYLRLVADLVESAQELEFEDIGFSKIVVPVGRLPDLDARACPLAIEANGAVPLLGEEEQALSARGMIADGSITAAHLHIADLTFSEILKNSVVAKSIRIPMLLSRPTCDQDDDWSAHGCADAALLLAAISGVDVASTVVELASLERPIHRTLADPVAALTEGSTFGCHVWPGRKAGVRPATALADVCSEPERSLLSPGPSLFERVPA